MVNFGVTSSQGSYTKEDATTKNKPKSNLAPNIIHRPLPIIPAVILSLRATKRFCIPPENLEYVNNTVKTEKRPNVKNNRPDTRIVPLSNQNTINKNNVPKNLSTSDKSNSQKHTPENSSDKSEYYLTTGIDFSDNGSFAAIVSQNSSITVVNCQEGGVARTIYSKKYGVGPMRFTHDSSHVLFASDFDNADPSCKGNRNGKSDVIRYLSVPDNTFTQYFHGHTDTVVDLAVAPQEDIFLSASLDQTIRLWDLRTPSSLKQISTVGRSNLAFDPTGKVLAVSGLDRKGITFYDLRQVTEGGFHHFNPHIAGSDSWTSLRFTNDGKRVVLGTSGYYHHIFDSITGVRTHHPLKRSSHSLLKTGQDITLTPDGRFLLSGNIDGSVDYWDLQSPDGLLTKTSNRSSSLCLSRSSSPENFPNEAETITTDFLPNRKLTSHSSNPITALGFNHRYMMMISGGIDYALWEPNLNNLFLQETEENHVNAKAEDYLYRPDSPSQA